MNHKVVLLTDPGIDGAFATTLALFDSDFEVLGLAATGGNVSSDVATRNVHILIENLDPPRWPRLGAAVPVEYDVDGTDLHGPGGLGGVEFPCARLHHPHTSDKLLTDLVRQYPREVTVVAIGPLTALARAIQREPELPELIQRIVCVGGAWHEPGNATAVSEFHFFCDPASARAVLRSRAPITLLPLDVTRKILFSPTDLLALPAPESAACRFLRQIVPHGIRATAGLFGVEGFHLKDVLGLVAVKLPEALTLKPMMVDVETRGELTRGMSVVDVRWGRQTEPNVEMAVAVDVPTVRQYIHRTLERTA